MALALLLTGCSGGDEGSKPLSSSDVGTPWVVPDTDLKDTSGADYRLTDGTTKPVTLVFFGYTNCPDICQMVMANIASAMTRLDDDERKQVEVVFVTTDPARDTEKVLGDYLERFDPTFIGATAKMDRILELGKAFKVAIEKGEKLPSGGYDVTHGTQVFLVDENDEIPMFWGQDTSSAVFARDISTLLKADS
nr:SCO family protein [Nocardioides daedukensis]